MVRLPKAAEPLVSPFSVAFSARTFQRVLVLLLGAILSLRRRTVTHLLRTVGPLAKGHWSDFHRVLCRAAWSCWPLGKVLDFGELRACEFLARFFRDQAL